MKNIIIAINPKEERDLLRRLLETNTNLGIIRDANSLEDVILMAETGIAGIAVIESDLSQEDEILRLRKLHYRHPDLQAIVVSDNDHQQTVKKAFEIGVKAYLLKDCSVEELHFAVDQVAKGRIYVCSVLGLKFMKQTSPLANSEDTAVNLTSRELEVLTLIAEGYTNYQIADKLFTSRRTVEGHRLSLSRKLGVKNSAQMIKVAYKSGLIEAA
ncbi:response regulator transcription factor [Desertivirga arenae]|uniref:response regulator transcription factor n=1 Tax=Desertivirga arenae TaxID=2810309 RepID=UPI001A979C70|nr:response regulator transcription factor [Pedobacter sp. SYSU D00823]